MAGDYLVKYKSAPTTYYPLCIRTLAMLHCTAKDKIREVNFFDGFEGAWGGGRVGNSLKFTPGICGIPRAKFVCFQVIQKELHKQTNKLKSWHMGLVTDSQRVKRPAFSILAMSSPVK